MSTKVDTDGLRAAGRGLAETAADATRTAPHCPPAASDPVSVSAAESLNSWSAALWTLLEHAGGLRESGGESIVAVAAFIGDVDAANARMIADVAGGGAVAVPTVPAMAAVSNTVPAPVVPSVPEGVAPPSMSAEDIAASVHAGPGTGHLWAFAEHWRDTVAPLILQTADETRRHVGAVQTHWEDGRQQAAVNVAEHAEWLESSLHRSALSLAQAAERVAEHTDTVIGNTPRPEELYDLKRRYYAALADYRASGGLDAAPAVALGTQWTQARGVTLTGYETFAAAAPVDSNHPWPPPQPAPPIVRGDGSPTPPKEPPTESPARSHGADEGRHGGAHRDDGEGADTEHADTPDAAPPVGPGGPPPTGTVPPLTDPNAPGTAASIAGTLTGAGIGAVGQITSGLHGLAGGASPMSALSGVSSLPGLVGGQPPMDSPQPSPDGGGGDPVPDVPAGDDFGTGGTTPASGGGDGGGGGAPVSSGNPTASGASATGPVVASPSAAAQTPSGTSGFGGGGMYAPPMTGGLGRGGDDAATSDDKRRVVHRPVPNTEPVFGEVERRRVSRRADKQEESN